MAIEFKRATRSQVPLKIGITGPSGSGKTTAAIKLTRGLVGPEAPIAFLDTENGSASLYCDITEFDALDMNPPYKVDKFLAALDAAVQNGYKALIIDSASHEWIELLGEKEVMDARGGNTYANWAPITKKHEQFLAAIRNAPIHVICCLRSKEKHEINEKKQVVKLGQGEQMRDGFAFELTVCWDLAMDHNAKASKDRTRLFDGRMETLTEATGRELAAWLTSGKPLAENTGEGFTPAVPTTPEPEELPAEWVDAVVAYTAALAKTGASEETRKELIQSYTDKGPSALAEIKAATAKLEAPEPTTVGAALAQVPHPAKPAHSAEVDAFVDGAAPKALSDSDWIRLQELCNERSLSVDDLAVYAQDKGHLSGLKTHGHLLRTLNPDKAKNYLEALSDKNRAHSMVTTIKGYIAKKPTAA